MAEKKKAKKNQVKFYDEEFLARKLGIERRHFHRAIKPRILSDFPEILEQLGADNPDIGLDENGIIFLSDTSHKNIISTDLNIESYIED